MNLEDEIAKTLSNEIAKEIDFDLMLDVLKACGWYHVELPTLGSRERSIDIVLWCESNSHKKYKHLGRNFIFEDQGDAVNFSLKWS